ncbi:MULTISPECIES: carbohydrate ABC transporter permease [Ensifer]|uniref:ABC transporter permease subunit n=1 Tax=Ensifer canadensis TaxID=555315 RepID=A0AAW4FSF9_9HYPH|nr:MULTISPECIES: carbohydrate ABC transporter permease [Ensifer]KQU88518.1 sugar ABC transporter permease [Ensifer sp. Root31]KQW56652.1 sugar ABC transporter permease [Ensifer sp. Root1252]KQW77896.1 sugar ABC transporter permease [Ensifer sp. Root127]KRC75031.1 sugar ABC transporter permease [Ensifer sp. Root231]KRC96499.1 sugar ABC transporter permease [Ensifer sp. Root258]
MSDIAISTPHAQAMHTRSAVGSLRIVQTACILVIALVIVSPLFMLLIASLKDDRFQILADMGSFRAFWVSDPTLANFAEVGNFSGELAFGRYLLNSLIILALTVGSGLIVNSMAGFVLAWGSVRGRAVILSLVIALYVIPQESIIMPLVIMVSRAGITDTFAVQIVPWIASPLYIFLFYQFFAQLPKELFEAAQIDGASIFRIYRSIFLPLSLPALATVSILMGIESWNQYLWPILVTQTDYARPIAVAIATFFGQDSIYWDRAMAASVLMMLPILALYLAFQRWFVSSFVGSAVKG